MSAITTEKQLLKMPKSAYMNTEQTAFFRHRLIALRDETLAHIEEVREQMTQGSSAGMDEVDQASREEMLNLQLRIIDRESKLLKKIAYSIKQIEDGLYGYCEETGEKIGLERLLLRPTATLCIDAKTMNETFEKDYSDVRAEE